jgi:hypothetical protein
MSSEAPRTWPAFAGFHANPYLSLTENDHKTSRGIAPFFRLTNQANIRPAYAVPFRLTGVFCAIENQDLARDSFRGNEIRILWHIPCPIDFTIVIDLLNDLDTRSRRDRMTAEFASFIVVIGLVELVGA